MIKLRNVYKSYNNGETFIVSNLSLDIKSGEILVIVGPSGCGKTTTLKMLNRLISPTQGHIEIDGKPIESQDPIQLRRSMGYAFQGVGLFPHMTVAENISVVLKLQKKSLAERENRAHALLKLVGLEPDLYAERRISELSGGQMQRVGVARALANEPRYLLMDEPFGALDSITRKNLQNELIRLNKELKKTIVFVTHDIFEALRIADRIVIMQEGTIEQVGTPEEILNAPLTDFVRELFQVPIKQLMTLLNEHLKH